MGVVLPPDPTILAEARRLIADRNLRVEDLATCTGQDPVIVIELLKSSNAMFYSGGRPPITSPKTAIVRLGQQVTQELFDGLISRSHLDGAEVNDWFEIHRSRCKRASIVARMLAEVVIKNFSDECQVAGLLAYVGDLLAVAYLKEDYVKLANDIPRSAINYKLAQEHRFDTEKVGLNYLRKNGMPEIILFALDRDALSRMPERAAMKPVIMASDEMVDAFDANRWDKLAPGKQLPSKSSLRLLQLSDAQYIKLYERASEYLFSMRIVDEKRKKGLVLPPSEPETPQEVIAPGNQSLQSEIEDLLSFSVTPSVTLKDAEPTSASTKQSSQTLPQSFQDPTLLKNDFGLSKGSSKPARIESPTRIQIPPPQLANKQSTKVVGNFANVIDAAVNTDDLLRSILGMLVGPGLFSKAALIVVSKDRKRAIVVAARGPNIGNGQTLIIDDPLSPLAECFSKVQSFGNRENAVSPFGSKAFALAPVDAPHETPVALYADCGNEASLPFEARRIFRNVIDILNQKLPYLPGGLPVEV